MSTLTIPADVARERDTLGIALVSGGHAQDLVKQANVDDFSRDAHRAIFEAIVGLIAAGNSSVDYLMVGAELDRRGQLQSIGGYAYLTDLSNLVVMAVPQSARIARLRELAHRRALLKIGDELTRRAVDPTMPINTTHKWLADSTLEYQIESLAR